MAPNPVKITEGTIPFEVEGQMHQTWYKVVGDLTIRTHSPLIVLHGGPGLSHDVMLPLSDLAECFNIPVIFYDQLGNARSTHLHDKPVSFWTIDLFIDELVNLLMHFEVHDDFDLIGHSWGGVLATEFEVRRQPIGLKHLVLTNTLASMSSWVESIAQLVKVFPRDVQEGLMVGMSDIKRHKAALQHFYAMHGCTVKPLPKEYLYSFEQTFGDNGDPTVATAFEICAANTVEQWSIVDRLYLVRVPTLVINGRADIAQDFVCEPLFRNIKKVKWVTFEMSSHMPMWEERERYMELTSEFLCL